MRKWTSDQDAHRRAIEAGLPWHREILVPRVSMNPAARPLKIRTPEDAAWLMGGLICASPVERMVAILCGPSGEVWRAVDLGRGDTCLLVASLPTLSRALLSAVALTGPAAVYLGHNHPSGRLVFSWADLQLTQAAKQIARLHGAVLLDHLLFTPDGRWLSWRLRYPAQVSPRLRRGRSSPGRPASPFSSLF